ncbi:MAG: hypothetical protein Q7T80_05885 [Methanoregula sp.]|nr:hypothetical protein [Methanoregula sp.]
MPEAEYSDNPVVCLGSFFEKEKPFLFAARAAHADLPHEESLSQNPSISYLYGNY